MNCDEAQQRLIDLVYGELGPDDAARCRDHAASCSDCGEELAALEQTQRALDDLPARRTRIDLARLCLKTAARYQRARSRLMWGTIGAAASLLLAAGMLMALVRVDVAAGHVVLAWRASGDPLQGDNLAPRPVPRGDTDVRLADNQPRDEAVAPEDSARREDSAQAALRQAYIRSGRYLSPDSTYLAMRDRVLALGLDALPRPLQAAPKESDGSAASYQDLRRELLGPAEKWRPKM